MSAPAAAPILRAAGLSIHFGALRAVDDVSIDIKRGGITSIIGPNGAGKSTLFNLLSGSLRPAAGKIQFDCDEITRLSPAQRLRRGLARSFQITNLFFELRVFENLRLACQYDEPRHKLWLPTAHSARAAQRAEQLLEKFGLKDQAATPAGALSHGEQRRLEIAVTLASAPKLLLLDEPTQGMSHHDTADTAELIQSVARDTTVLLIEHDVDLVMGLSERVIVMALGRKLTEGTPAEVRGNADVQAAYFGDRKG